MKKSFLFLSLVFFITACVAGEFEPERNRLHDMGKTGICEKNPDRCIEGTNIDW